MGYGTTVRQADTDTGALVTIVGGGVHGVHLAVRLLQADLIDLRELCIVDPASLLESFRRKCRQCGMVEFRSPFGYHADTDPFSLREYTIHGIIAYEIVFFERCYSLRYSQS